MGKQREPSFSIFSGLVMVWRIFLTGKQAHNAGRVSTSSHDDDVSAPMFHTPHYAEPHCAELRTGAARSPHC